MVDKLIEASDAGVGEGWVSNTLGDLGGSVCGPLVRLRDWASTQCSGIARWCVAIFWGAGIRLDAIACCVVCGASINCW